MTPDRCVGAQRALDVHICTQHVCNGTIMRMIKNADADVMLKTVRMMNAADLQTLRTRGREEQWRLLCRRHRWLTL